MNKVVVLISRRFNVFTKDRLGFKFFQASKIEIEVWDLADIYLEKPDSLGSPSYETFDGLHTFKKMSNVKVAIENECLSTLFICSIPFSNQSKEIFQSLTKKKQPYLVRQTKMHPNAKSFNKYLGNNNLKSKIRFFFSWRRKILPPKYVILATDFSKYYLPFKVGRNTNIIKAHVDDYNYYLGELKNESVAYSGNYVVFIDQNLSGNSDFNLLKKTFPVTSEKYFSSLNNFFNLIEKQLNVEVVIAAHPKSTLEFLSKQLSNRRVFYNCTARLIKNCKFVLGHYSTAYNFAVLFSKPILSLTTSELYNTPIEDQIKFITNLLDSPLIDIDNYENTGIVVPQVNMDYYRSYEEKYIKEGGTLRKNTWHILTDLLKKEDDSKS